MTPSQDQLFGGTRARPINVVLDDDERQAAAVAELRAAGARFAFIHGSRRAHREFAENQRRG